MVFKNQITICWPDILLYQYMIKPHFLNDNSDASSLKAFVKYHDIKKEAR